MEQPPINMLAIIGELYVKSRVTEERLRLLEAQQQEGTDANAQPV